MAFKMENFESAVEVRPVYDCPGSLGVFALRDISTAELARSGSCQQNAGSPLFVESPFLPSYVDVLRDGDKVAQGIEDALFGENGHRAFVRALRMMAELSKIADPENYNEDGMSTCGTKNVAEGGTNVADLHHSSSKPLRRLMHRRWETSLCLWFQAQSRETQREWMRLSDSSRHILDLDLEQDFSKNGRKLFVAFDNADDDVFLEETASRSHMLRTFSRRTGSTDVVRMGTVVSLDRESSICEVRINMENCNCEDKHDVEKDEEQKKVLVKVPAATLKTPLGVYETNCLGGKGLFRTLSRINHSCCPNARIVSRSDLYQAPQENDDEVDTADGGETEASATGYSDSGGVQKDRRSHDAYDEEDMSRRPRNRKASMLTTTFSMTPFWCLVARRDIRAGEEITISYCDEALDVRKRQVLLKSKYGFECKCTRCESDLDRSALGTA
ncbi:unnamed protein product [Amoebophrya sp. A25]|nr:unnamed protein product [Amoebophrya sp. A25]|eukprot:GSA25T00009738001.1